MISIEEYIKTRGAEIEEHLNLLVPMRQEAAGSLFEAARYSLLGGGKRLRPLIALATAETLGYSSKQALTPVCTLEMIHTYSLIHDDLPCMDDDDYRRGKLTLHKQYSEGHAVLTGDYLLTYAFELLATDPHLASDKKVRLITTLAKKSGGEGMIGGQVIDLAAEGMQIDLTQLQNLHSKKTGALLTAAVEFGGILADADLKTMKHLHSFGENIGLAFQIVDDILDVTSSHAKHGRAIASDVLNDKTTYVTLLGLEKAKACAHECYERAVADAKALPGKPDLLISLADFVINRTH